MKFRTVERTVEIVSKKFTEANSQENFVRVMKQNKKHILYTTLPIKRRNHVIRFNHIKILSTCCKYFARFARDLVIGES